MKKIITIVLFSISVLTLYCQTDAMRGQDHTQSAHKTRASNDAHALKIDSTTAQSKDAKVKIANLGSHTPAKPVNEVRSSDKKSGK